MPPMASGEKPDAADGLAARMSPSARAIAMAGPRASASSVFWPKRSPVVRRGPSAANGSPASPPSPAKGSSAPSAMRLPHQSVELRRGQPLPDPDGLDLFPGAPARQRGLRLLRSLVY